MKKFLVILAVAFSGFVFGQDFKPEYFLGKVFYDSISFDQFLIKQRYADYKVGGFILGVGGELDPTLWIYKQDFSQYSDSSKYRIVYEAISFENGFQYEYFDIYNLSDNKLIREIGASYEIGTNLLVGLMDSDISF